METRKNREHLANFFIAGLTYYEAPLCFKKLKIGTRLTLVWEKDNKYDARAVAIYYKDFKLGFVPRTENRIFYKLLKMGHSDLFELLIQQVDPHAYPEQQIRVVAHLIGEEG
ncbi:HIRAN domain-containing protein [Riemerella columbina]|uniref:HIRAN domain-containing protein n=1 Tax=Riemerella columbina TaxID=103810 RepID=UPI00267002E8|nr:HIRAN domain-containing protein [Riemerella columbina]WKS95350.1 HIRAN domain-containing protein [Riemerella columbina]